MKISQTIILITVISYCQSCNNSVESAGSLDTRSGATISADSLANSRSGKVSTLQEESDLFLLNLSEDILRAVKSKDFDKLQNYIHPQMGLRFSPYSYIDTLNSQKFQAKQIADLLKTNKKIKWGDYDGSGKPIILSIEEYFEKFVCDVDFINSGTKAINKNLRSGTSANNLSEIFHDAEFAEFLFSLPNGENDDWRVIRLVFRSVNNKYYLVGLVHDQWTP